MHGDKTDNYYEILHQIHFQECRGILIANHSTFNDKKKCTTFIFYHLIDIKTENAHKQYWDSTLATNHALPYNPCSLAMYYACVIYLL